MLSKRNLIVVGLVLIVVVVLVLALYLPQESVALSCDEDLGDRDSRHFLFGRPVGMPESNILIEREIYDMSFNPERKLADWVGYCLDVMRISGESKRADYYTQDPKLEELEIDTLEHDDYNGAHDNLGLDRGHLAPNASFYGHGSWADVNWISNIVPQDSDLNQDKWEEIESQVRNLVKNDRLVFVVTGPIYEPTSESTRQLTTAKPDDDQIEIPSGFFKVIMAGNRAREDSIEIVAFVFDQENPPTIHEKLASIRNIEKITGLNFNPEATDQEWETSRGEWPFN